MPDTKPSRFNLDSLRSRLLLLVVLALVPPVGLTIHGAMRERAHAVQVAESDLQRLTGVVAASEAKSIEGMRQFLLALSDVPDLLREPAACNELLRTMLKKNTGYINLGVVDLAGNVRCSAIASSTAVNLGDRDYFQKTLASGRFATGDHVVGRIVRRHAITASYPIRNEEGKMLAMVYAALDLESLDKFATDIDFPANAILVTTDGTGTIIGRRPNPEQWIGKPAPANLFDVMGKVRFGTAEVTGADGIQRLHAFAPVGTPDVSNYTVSIGIPTADIVSSANQQQKAELLSLLAIAILALLTAWFVANVTILDRVHALLGATRRLGEGALDARSGIRYGREEISELALAFDRMADSLQRSAAERDEAQAHLFAEKERAQVTLQSIGDGVITTDGSGRIDYMNPVAQQLTGWTTAAAVGKPLDEVFKVINGTTREPLVNLLNMPVAHGQADALGRDSVLIARDGAEYAVEDSASPIRDREQAVVGTVVVFHDVSQSRNMARQLSHQASHDPLTGLVNRREFERRLQLTLDHSTTQARQHALLFLDLDRFKIVNDTCGHNAGDELLRQITALLQPLLRDSDTLARVGGDEFAALLENCTLASAARIAEKLCKTVCDFRFAWADQVFPIGVSIGLVHFTNNERSMADLLTAADGACYQAKDAGRNRVHQYRPDEGTEAAHSGGNEWHARVEQALDDERFILLSQEIRSLGAVGRPLPQYEMQLRMLDAAGGHVLPTAFMPAAERYGLMPRVDRWTMRHALAHHATLQPPRRHVTVVKNRSANAFQRTICALTLSASALNDPLFIDFLNDLFAEFGVAHDSVCFNIAETTAIAHLSKTMHFIDVMKPRGCLFALDDFGGGMSSFAYLVHLRVDYLRIDGAFIADMGADPVSRAKVEAINHVAHAMGLQTIAKHVDSQGTLDMLRTIRVDHAQGDAVAAAVPVATAGGMPLLLEAAVS